MAINEFKPFAATAEANVQEQADYEQSEVIRAGFRTGLARSAEVNKAIRQASSIAAAVAEFTAEKSGKDMLDNGDIGLIRENFETALSAVSSLLVTEAGGTGDALTAVFTPAVKELRNGLLVHVRAREKNGSKTPTFKADETAAKTIVKGNNLSLDEGDIAGAGHWLEMQYDAALDKWVLLNPAKGIVSQQSGVPVGTIEYFAAQMPPAGYLKADGAAVGRETFPDLFGVIGTTYGEGDGETTFNLPDLIDRFAQGSNTPGQKIEAGLPNITGFLNASALGNVGSEFGHSPRWVGCVQVGAKEDNEAISVNRVVMMSEMKGSNVVHDARIDASHSNCIYGASDTVQPPALTLLPCIKAFDAATNPGLIDITQLANEVSSINQVTETFNDGTNWYRKWSDGWVEQGGMVKSGSTGIANLLVALSGNYYVIANQRPYSNLDTRAIVTCAANDSTTFKLDALSVNAVSARQALDCNFYACGKGLE